MPVSLSPHYIVANRGGDISPGCPYLNGACMARVIEGVPTREGALSESVLTNRPGTRTRIYIEPINIAEVKFLFFFG